MDKNFRLLLLLSIVLTGMLLVSAWFEDQAALHAPPPAPGKVAATPNIPTTTAAAPAVPTATTLGVQSGQRIKVVTDVFSLELDTRGGDIRIADLLKYPVKVDQPDEPTRLLSDNSQDLARAKLFYITQSGLIGQAGLDHHAVYQATQTTYTLADGSQTLTVPLTLTTPDGLTVQKIYTFKRGKYDIDLTYRVNNHSPQPITLRQYRQFQRLDPQEGLALIPTYTGGVMYSPQEKYKKIPFDEMAKAEISHDVQDGWLALIQHYFVGAWLPKRGEVQHFYSKALGENRYTLGMTGPEVQIPSGQAAAFEGRLVLSPKTQGYLKSLHEGLELTVDYGILTIISKPLFWLLEFFYGVVGNWGWAIVLLTLSVKLAFFWLSASSYRSMANMRKLTPKMQQIKERYGDDRQRFGQEMMALYKKEKVNPLGGCLPMLVQIPVFIALYWVLLESVELRQATFLWINDLADRDYWYILPVLMGVTMYIQQKLNPPPPDPMMAKIMTFLPFIFTAFFAFFPAGLVLYWVTNNVLSIAQQWAITRSVERAQAQPKEGKA